MTDTPSRQPASPGLRMALDYGPLLVFFAVNFLMPGVPIVRVLAATGAFMAAMVVAVIVSWVKTRHVSPMLWLTAALVIVFGGLTLYFHDQKFIQMKPTFVYALFAGVLTFGLVTGKPLLQQLLGTAYAGLDEEGWCKLTRNWAVFFVGMAAANEIIWRWFGWDVWVAYKLWGAIPLTLLFAVANVPMLLRHGLQTEAPVPPEG